jgi:hypothetical protein
VLHAQWGFPDNYFWYCSNLLPRQHPLSSFYNSYFAEIFGKMPICNTTEMTFCYCFSPSSGM